MKLFEIIRPSAGDYAKLTSYTRGYKPSFVAKHYVRRTKTAIPDEVRPFLLKHVKKTDENHLYVNEYESAWYRHVFRKDLDIADFRTFFNKKLSPYFELIT